MIDEWYVRWFCDFGDDHVGGMHIGVSETGLVGMGIAVTSRCRLGMRKASGHTIADMTEDEVVQVSCVSNPLLPTLALQSYLIMI